MSTVSSVSSPEPGSRVGPPAWLIGATGLLAVFASRCLRARRQQHDLRRGLATTGAVAA